MGFDPFGGFKLSGTGPKAGSREYLRAFHFNPEAPLRSSKFPDEEPILTQVPALAPPCRLPVDVRLARFWLAVDLLISHFESLYQGIFGDQKEVLVRFHQWIKRQMYYFITREHANLKIPGQYLYLYIPQKFFLSQLSLKCKRTFYCLL